VCLKDTPVREEVPKRMPVDTWLLVVTTVTGETTHKIRAGSNPAHVLEHGFG